VRSKSFTAFRLALEIQSEFNGLKIVNGEAADKPECALRKWIGKAY